MTIDTWLAISAGATFLLALVAFWAIWQNHSLQKRERKDRLLNEIIEWATGISRGSLDKDMENLVNDIECARELAAVNIDEWEKYSKEVPSKNKYIIKIASNFDNDLQESVKKLDTLLRYRIELQIPYFQGREPGYKLKLPKNKLEIYQCANKVTERATKLL